MIENIKKAIKITWFAIKWHWENRRWENCRHKRRSYGRALDKYVASLG